MLVKPTALTTVENAKAALGVKTTADDALIGSLIDRATSWIEDQTNRRFKARNYNNDNTTTFTPGDPYTAIDSEDFLYFSGSEIDDGGDTLENDVGYGLYHAPQWPILRPSVAGALAVQLAILTARAAGADGAGDTWDATVFLEGRDYVVDYARGIVTKLGKFTAGVKNYRLSCTAGYYLGTNQPFVPDDLEQLAIEMVRLVYKDRRNLKAESIGTWSREWDTSLQDPIVYDTLSKYRRLVI